MSHTSENLQLLITSDSEGYFQYLPYFFIKGDLHRLPYAIGLPNGNTLNLYHIGVAILQAPFFLLAHLYALLFNIEPTGFTRPYLLSIFVAAASYLSIACYMLTVVISKNFGRLVAIISVSLILLATNLLYYSSHEAGMSHVYSFFLFTLFISNLDKCLKNLSAKRSIYLGLTLGLIAIVRPSNLIVGICIPMWGVSSIKEFKERLAFLISKPLSLLLFGLSLGVALLPQLLYWKLVTGDFFVFSYGQVGQGFNWGSPELLNVLFSPQNGWLIYSPIMLFSLVGLAITSKNMTFNSYAILPIILITYYIFSSWWAWWFGAAYGHRAFIDYYPFLLFPLAFVIQRLLDMPSLTIKYLMGSLFIFFIYLNIRMTFLYNPPWDGPDWGWSDYLIIIKQVFFI
ncbi:MAG: hypothetical protein JKY18_12860 [Flavobacteriales bacterium]|nr:hypothetical protein [Flavobacteriales bacterium]